MKYIKDRQKFLNEAKIRDLIFKRQANEVIKIWGENTISKLENTNNCEHIDIRGQNMNYEN